ncbi:hypothetical protein [Rhodococcus sovatensis]|uniref:Uncharacterized protein n=1 Tax=Rhodococcus sovatensis TaxID=1805840 RepID=A0ABZ2PEZ0_9NOCA
MILIAIAVLLWVVAFVRLARWAASPALSPSLGAAIVLSSLAARVTLFNVPALSEWLDNVTSWPNLATLAQLLFLVSATAGAQIVVIGLIPEIGSPGRIVRYMLALGLVVAVLVTVLFAAAGRRSRLSVYEYASEYSADGWIAGAFLLTIGYGATGCVAITTISIRTLRRSGSRWRPQLLLLAIGSGLFACYALSRAALIWASRVDKHWSVRPVFDAGSAIAAVACVLVVIGLTWESAGAVVRAWRYLKRSQALFAQIDLVAPDMTKQADRVAGWSVTRRAEARSVAILDFLTL